MKFALLLIAALARAEDLPPSPARDLLQSNCTGCHTTEPISRMRATRAGWESILDDMQSRGVSLSTSDRIQILDYLAKYFPKALKINVNSASVDELSSVLEISKPEAESIAKYRVEHGDFHTLGDLAKIVDRKKVDAKKDVITF